MLATETGLSAQAMVELYARRWGIEPLFHKLKRRWSIASLWQQSRTALETWMQIRSTALTLAQLLSLAVDEAFPLREVAPWRDGHPLLVVQWLRIEFTGLAFATVLTQSRKNSASQSSAATRVCRLDRPFARLYSAQSLRGTFDLSLSQGYAGLAESKVE